MGAQLSTDAGRLRLAARFANWPIRRKLQALVLMPLLGVLPVLGVLLLLWINAALDRLLVTKVRADLAVAHGYFERVLGEVAASAGSIAESHAVHRALQAWVPGQPLPAQLQALLAQFKARERLDFVNLRSAEGELLLTDFGTAPGVPALAPDRAGTERVAASVDVLPPLAQAVLAPDLRARVAVDFVPTRNARPSTRSREDRAMIVHAVAAVRRADGTVLARVQAGTLLNRNLAFIDHINDIVYPPGSLPFGSLGTATLFLDDVRISTNVRLFGEQGETRAIGTRVSQTVREAVLERGQTWLDNAFVVNDWYFSAYEPLADARGRPVGMLYVGFLERPFAWMKWGVLAALVAVLSVVMVLAALAAARWARVISQPMERMARTMDRVQAGALDARVGSVGADDELGALAAHLDRLLDTIDDNTRELKRWNSELDAKVAERTRELEAAQQQLLRSEKMAAIGQLTASIAHEVNNPIAVIQGNLDLARELLGDHAERVRTELQLVDAQIDRMRLIVTQLLQFARPNEYAGYVEAVDPGRTLDECLLLAGHLLARTRIEVRRDYLASRSAAINRQELQQVLVNLMVNAIHAMPDGGTLTLRTRDWEAPPVVEGDPARPGIVIEVLDTGPGLSAELLRELFQPFVTRKKDGTGLGLWISRGIVERYGGDIRAANHAAGGAVMSVWLLCEEALPAIATGAPRPN